MELVVVLASPKRMIIGVHDPHQGLQVGVVALPLREVDLVPLKLRSLEQLLDVGGLLAAGHADEVAVLRASVAALVRARAVRAQELEIFFRKGPVLTCRYAHPNDFPVAELAVVVLALDVVVAGLLTLGVAAGVARPARELLVTSP